VCRRLVNARWYCSLPTRWLDRRRKYRDVTRDLKTNRRRARRSHACTQFGMLPEGREQAAVVKSWWRTPSDEAANVGERGLLQVMQLL
jgi:hypothetical protein